jgi:hypothetical protein
LVLDVRIEDGVVVVELVVVVSVVVGGGGGGGDAVLKSRCWRRSGDSIKRYALLRDDVGTTSLMKAAGTVRRSNSGMRDMVCKGQSSVQQAGHAVVVH